MTKKLLMALFVCLVSFGLTGLYLSRQHQSPTSSQRYEHLGGDFSLNHKSGRKNLKDFAGKPIIMYFGFTTCPDICPLALHKLNRALDELELTQRQQIHKLFIGVDYKRDDVNKVDDYVRYFADDFMGLAGSQQEIEEITKKYAVHFEFVPMKDSALGYTVDHTSRYFLVDKRGKLVNSYSDISEKSTFLKDLRSLL